MWPSTGPGDISGRSLGEDDIAGACEIYPNGGEVPVPDMEPAPVAGTAEFGDPCAEERCVDDHFCINDGRDLYCSRNCTPGDESCGEGYYCAYLSGVRTNSRLRTSCPPIQSVATVTTRSTTTATVIGGASQVLAQAARLGRRPAVP